MQNIGLNIKCSPRFLVLPALACMLSLCGKVSGQTQDELRTQAAQFQSRFLTTCGKEFFTAVNSQLDSCGDEPRRNNTCIIYTEYTRVRFTSISEDPEFSEADSLNGIQYDGLMHMEYGAQRYRVSLGNKWGPWNAWVDGGATVIFRFWKKGDKWFNHQTNDNPLLGIVFGHTSKFPDPSSRTYPEPVTTIFGKLSCTDLLNSTPHVAITAPFATSATTAAQTSHQLNETYAQAMVLMRSNKDKGIPDPYAMAVNSNIPIQVCSSITEDPKDALNDPRHLKSRCDATGESVRVPGDLVFQSGFWDRGSLGAYGPCKQRPQPIAVEVTLAGEQDTRKRYIRCKDLDTIGGLRITLAAYSSAK